MCAQTRSVNIVYLANRKCAHEAEAQIVVLVVRGIVVAIGGTQVLRIVVPATAADDAVGATSSIITPFLKKPKPPFGEESPHSHV